jgi:hypothetical protein
MRDLNDRIARLEMCSEQLRLHLRSVPRDSLEAEEVRSDLLSMLQELAMLKGERQRLAHSLRLEVVA